MADPRQFVLVMDVDEMAVMQAAVHRMCNYLRHQARSAERKGFTSALERDNARLAKMEFLAKRLDTIYKEAPYG